MASRILIVDDNSQFLKAARDLLERQGVDVVGVASSSEEAARLADELRPDGVLVDVDLGPENGFDVAERLVVDHGQAVVFISAYSEAEVADLVATSPALGFISKVDLSARRIAEVLHGGASST